VSITLVEDQFRTFLANLNLQNWIIRWANENWPPMTPLGSDNQPVDPVSKAPAPFVEAEVISGLDIAAIAPAGQRWSQMIGLFRVFLVVPQGSGRGPLNLNADVVHDALKRQTIYLDTSNGLRLTTMDPRIDDNVAEHTAQTDVRIDAAVPAPWKGARYTRMVSTPFIFEYYS
jgi:hypothetical protein